MPAPIALAFRIAPDLSTLKANLAEAVSQIETTKTALQKMANGFDGSKIIADANAMVLAINKIGGASALTESEQARVNATVTAALDKYAALGRQAPQALQDLANATEHTSNIFDDLKDHAGSFFVQMVSAQAIIGAAETAWHTFTEFLESSLESYAEAETAARRLTVAVQTQGLAIPGLADQYLQLGDAFEQTTAFSHTAIDGAEALFVQLGNVGPDLMGRALQAATDLASGLGMDLNSAVELLSKAAEGQTQTFTRYGIVLDQAKVKSEGFGYVLDAIEQKVGGQAQAELDTYAGKAKQLGNDWEDVKEKIGGAILDRPAVSAALDLITKAIQGQIDILPKLKVNWAEAFEVFAPGTSGFGKTVNDGVAALDAFAKAQQQYDAAVAKLHGDVNLGLPDGMTAMSKDGVNQLNAWQKSADEAAKAFQKAMASMENTLDGADLAKKVTTLSAALNDLAAKGRATPDVMAATADQAQKLAQQGASLTSQLRNIAGGLNDVKTGLTSLAGMGTALAPLQIPVDAVIASLNDKLVPLFQDKLPKTIFDMGADARQSLTETADAIKKQSDDAQKATQDAIKKTEEEIQQLGRAFDTLGSAIGGNIGTAITDFGHMVTAIDAAKKAFDAIGQEGQTALGALASGLTGAIGLISAAIGPAESLFTHFFGTAGRDAVTSFAESMGGFDALHQQLDQLGASGEQMWKQLTQDTGRNDLPAAQAEIQKIQTALDSLHTSENSQISDLLSKIQSFGGAIDPALDPYIQKLQQAGILTADNAKALQGLEGDGTPSYQTLTQLQQKYNLTAAQMGPAFQVQQINANFQSVIDDLDTLTKGGADVTAALFSVGSDGSKSLDDLGKAVQGDIEAAIQAGTQIPANLKPIAQALIDQGDLIDGNGKKITDISQLSFGNTMQTDLENLNTTLTNLILKLTGPNDSLSAAIGAVPRHVDVVFNASKSGDWSAIGNGGGDVATAATGGIVTRGKVIPFPTSYFDLGGFVPRGTDTVPAMLTPGEMVLNADQQRRLLDGGGDIVIHHQTVLDGKVIDQRIQRVSRRNAATGKLRTRVTAGRSF